MFRYEQAVIQPVHITNSVIGVKTPLVIPPPRLVGSANIGIPHFSFGEETRELHEFPPHPLGRFPVGEAQHPA